MRVYFHADHGIERLEHAVISHICSHVREGNCPVMRLVVRCVKPGARSQPSELQQSNQTTPFEGLGLKFFKEQRDPTERENLGQNPPY